MKLSTANFLEDFLYVGIPLILVCLIFMVPLALVILKEPKETTKVIKTLSRKDIDICIRQEIDPANCSNYIRSFK